jgi:hypothetical protein
LRKVCAFVEGGVASRNSRITVDSVSTRWPVERVIPLSLIANELLTNSVKHAPPDTDLAVSVSLARKGTQMRFSVETLNTRLPDGFEIGASGLGLKIASMLAQQLGGKLTSPRLPDAVFVVEFPRTHASERSRCLADRPSRTQARHCRVAHPPTCRQAATQVVDLGVARGLHVRCHAGGAAAAAWLRVVGGCASAEPARTIRTSSGTPRFTMPISL